MPGRYVLISSIFDFCDLWITGYVMTAHAGGGGWKNFESAASADDGDVVENCTRKRARDEDSENEARKAFNQAGGDGEDDNTKGILTDTHASGRFLNTIPIDFLLLPLQMRWEILEQYVQE